MGAYAASMVVEPSLLSMLINVGSTHHPPKQYPRSLKQVIGGQSKKHRIMREILNSLRLSSQFLYSLPDPEHHSGRLKTMGFPTGPLLNFFLKHLDSHSPGNMVKLSEQLRETSCDVTSTVSMCVDGVTPPAGHEHTHVFVLTDPSQQSFPRFHSIREISASGIDSATAILDEVRNLYETGVRIHCFVTDGGSGYYWAHKLNTALRHLHSRSVLLRASLELLSTFSETVPISKTDVPNPPKFIGSRWISCGPIVQWYRANRQSLSTLMALSDSELHFMDLLHDLINPLFNTVGILERNTMSIANSPPLPHKPRLSVVLPCTKCALCDSVSKGVEVAVEIDEVVRFTRPLASSFIPQLTQTSSMVANLEILLESTFPKAQKEEIDRNLSTYEVWLEGGTVPNQHHTLLRTPPTQAAAERTIKVVKRHASLKRPRLSSKTNDAILRVASLPESFHSLPPIEKRKRDESSMQMELRVNGGSDSKSIRTDPRSLDEIRFDARYARCWTRGDSVTNGSCFYHSILLLLPDVDLSVSELRRQTVEYMNQNRESIDVDTFLHDWENRMSENLLQTTPVEMWEIVAVSHLLQRQIIIHSSCMRPIATMLQPSQVVRQQPALRVAYVNGNHYQPMIPVAK
ncbi:hypothetical protein BLNAU_12220 [Blattamonas nauphoetae]|uniref:OTU domain-containing protein n=1 Tax=Blattamonas nauphoetae TaxID=2049346 RepID=A0ABQ9XQ22_9EUKA|nr:hypothetical protein BLNAU_12220 [Blattamonas nauphoetae]